MEENSNQPVNTTQETTAQVPVPPQPSVAPKSHKKRNIFISVVGAIILLTAGVGLGYVLFGSVLVAPQVTNYDNNSDDQAVKLSPEDITSKIKDSFAAKYTLVDVAEDRQLKEGEVAFGVNRRAPLYKAESYDFFNDYDGGSSIDFTPYSSSSLLPTSEDVSLRREVVDIYKEFGLEKQPGYYGEDVSEVYSDSWITCTVPTPTSGIHPNSASCGLITEYERAAKTVKPLATAMPSQTGTLFFTDVDISNSQVSGYQKASVNYGTVETMGGAQALFYKKGLGEWQFFVSTQQIVPCSAYNTEDLKNAFKGESCLIDANAGSLGIV